VWVGFDARSGSDRIAQRVFNPVLSAIEAVCAVQRPHDLGHHECPWCVVVSKVRMPTADGVLPGNIVFLDELLGPENALR